LTNERFSENCLYLGCTG